MSQTSGAAGAAIRLIWKCTKPRDATVVSLCENLMLAAARKYNMDCAVIRASVHSTTRQGGKRVQTVPHITGDIVDLKRNVGYALHYNLQPDQRTPTAGSTSAPNPEVWQLTHKDNKGFVLVQEDGTEENHDMEGVE
ncbi:unnamed protein product [Peniophora sp. CBMAI 1063]|nr:unnamed protein product [Peniophora sp. CBMAI 1063]